MTAFRGNIGRDDFRVFQAKTTRTKKRLKTMLACAIVSAGLAAVPAGAVEFAFGGNDGTTTPDTIAGANGAGNLWQAPNAPEFPDGRFNMAGLDAPGQTTSLLNSSNGPVNYATSFPIALNNSRYGKGSKGVSLDPAPSAAAKGLTPMSDVLAPSTWVKWDIDDNLQDVVSGLFQQIRFTAPAVTELAQGPRYDLDINFAAMKAGDLNGGASFDETKPPPPGVLVLNVPTLLSNPALVSAQINFASEPASIALLALSILGMGVVSGRKRFNGAPLAGR